MRLIRRAVGIDDEVQPGLDNFEVAQRKLRTEKAEDAHLHAQAVDFGVGRFAGILEAVNHDAVRFGLEMEQTPVKGSDLGAAAGEVFDLSDETLAHPDSRTAAELATK